MSLTGKTRYRTSLFGRVILQVEEERSRYSDDGHCGYPEAVTLTRWRDARLSDLFAMEKW